MKRLTYINILLMFMLAVGCNSKVCLKRENNVVTRGDKREEAVSEGEPKEAVTGRRQARKKIIIPKTIDTEKLKKELKEEQEIELKKLQEELEKMLKDSERLKKFTEKPKESDSNALDKSELDKPDFLDKLDDLINELKKLDLSELSALLQNEARELSLNQGAPGSSRR